jgi:DeoR/GlpR family transcriptional regulator of sugar metabolism
MTGDLLEGDSVLKAERRAEILKLVREQGAVHVPNLSQRFQVSPSTVRRDLERLAEQGELERTHGGAVLAAVLPDDAEKAGDVAGRIGQAAADLVSPGETVFIGPGPLCQATAQRLRHRSEITILTNALEIAWTLYQGSTLPLILTGGPVTRPGGALVGRLALQAMDTLRADRLIIEVAGVSPLKGLTGEQLPQADVTRSLLEMVSQNVILTTPERLGRAGAAWLGPVSEADVIITARDAPTAIVWDLSETGVKVTLV